MPLAWKLEGELKYTAILAKQHPHLFSPQFRERVQTFHQQPRVPQIPGRVDIPYVAMNDQHMASPKSTVSSNSDTSPGAGGSNHNRPYTPDNNAPHAFGGYRQEELTSIVNEAKRELQERLNEERDARLRLETKVKKLTRKLNAVMAALVQSGSDLEDE